MIQVSGVWEIPFLGDIYEIMPSILRLDSRSCNILHVRTSTGLRDGYANSLSPSYDIWDKTFLKLRITEFQDWWQAERYPRGDSS